MSRKDYVTDLLGIQGWEVEPGGVAIDGDEVVVRIRRVEGSGYFCGCCGEGLLFAYDHLAEREVRSRHVGTDSLQGSGGRLRLEPSRVRKFHVYGYLSKAVDEVRRTEQNRADKEGKDVIKGSRWLWLRASRHLQRKQKQTLREIMTLNENLQKAYLLKEDFEQFYASTDREAAEQFLKEWIARCQESGLGPPTSRGWPNACYDGAWESWPTLSIGSRTPSLKDSTTKSRC